MLRIMDFGEVLRRRKAVRNYSEEPIPRETLERIVERGKRIPSGGYSQGLRLVVVTDRATRHRIAELADEQEYVAMGFEPWISRAPAHVVIGTREEDYHERYRQPDKLQEDGTEIHWPVPYWHVDAGASMMLLMLAAIDEGLAAGVFGVLEWAPIWKLLGIPGDILPVAIVTVGKAAPEPEEMQQRRKDAMRKRRRPLEEVIRWEHW
jgi:nitroreductase